MIVDFSSRIFLAILIIKEMMRITGSSSQLFIALRFANFTTNKMILMSPTKLQIGFLFQVGMCKYDQSMDKIWIWQWMCDRDRYHSVFKHRKLVIYSMSLLGSELLVSGLDIPPMASNCEMERRVVRLMSLWTCAPATIRVFSHQGFCAPGRKVAR